MTGRPAWTGGRVRQWPRKQERAELLMLALAALLLRGGERVRLLGGPIRLRGGRGALEALAEALSEVPDSGGMPPDAPLPRHGRLVLIGDFWRRWMGYGSGSRGWPPSRCRVTWCRCWIPRRRYCPIRGGSGSRGRSANGTSWCRGWRASAACMPRRWRRSCTGWRRCVPRPDGGFTTHRTDHAPESALLAMYAAMART